MIQGRMMRIRRLRQTFYQNVPRLTPAMIDALTREIEADERRELQEYIDPTPRVWYIVLPTGGKVRI